MKVKANFMCKRKIVIVNVPFSTFVFETVLSDVFLHLAKNIQCCLIIQ